MRHTGFTTRWILGSLVTSLALHAGISRASETEIVRGQTTVFYSAPRAAALPVHQAQVPAYRTVMLQPVLVTASPVQALPRGASIDCGARRGVVETGRRDARTGISLPSRQRCL